MTGLTSAGCRDCRDGLAHCHGVLVLHAEDHAECVDQPDCAGGVDQHEVVLSCAAAFGDCSCGA